MREALRAHRPTLHSLDMVVTDSGRCLQTSGDIGIVDDLALLGAVRPDTGKAVCLQLEINRERVSLGGILTGEPLDLLLDSENVLNVVAKFVSDDVSLREVRIAAAETSKLIPEAEVDIDLFVRRTIERPGLRLRNTAA